MTAETLELALLELLQEWRSTCKQMGLPYRDEDAAAFLAESYPCNRLVGASR